MNVQRLEEAGFNAVPALEQIFYDGWLIRFARGFTGRRNSVNALYNSMLDLPEKIAWCEALFAARGLPPVFRLTPLAPAGLDAALAQRGYVLRPERVLVMVADLDPARLGGGKSATVVPHQLNEWLPLHQEIGHMHQEHQELHRELLTRISGQPYFITSFDSIRPAASVLAVREGELVGIFEMVTAPDLRRRGHGANVVRAALALAAQDGARQAYLQVMETNAPAVALYEKLGFTTAYRYTYRTKR